MTELAEYEELQADFDESMISTEVATRFVPFSCDTSYRFHVYLNVEFNVHLLR